MKPEKRKSYLDFMRIYAAFFVIFNHLPGYMLFANSQGIKVWIYTVISVITKINVPIFFMISGSLLLSSNESIGEILKKRVLRMLCVLFLFSSIIYLLNTVPQRELSFEDFVRGLISGDILLTYWFLYAYISFLCMIPFLRKIVLKFTRQEYIYLLIVHFIFATMLPIVNYILSIKGYDQITVSSNLLFPLMTEWMFFYPLVGYYIDNMIDIRKIEGKHFKAIGSVTVLGIVISCVLVRLQIESGEFSKLFLEMFTWVNAIVFFLTCKYFFFTKSALLNISVSKIICFIGSLTFGMYLLDPVYKILFFIPYQNRLEPFLPTLVVSGGWCVMSMCLSGGVTYLLKKVPGLKKML